MMDTVCSRVALSDADMTNSRNCDTKLGSPSNKAQHSKPAQSPYWAQLIFVLTFLFVVLSVMGEYIVGAFIGLNAGEDFGLILGGTIVTGICVGLLVGALHDRSGNSMHR